MILKRNDSNPDTAAIGDNSPFTYENGGNAFRPQSPRPAMQNRSVPIVDEAQSSPFTAPGAPASPMPQSSTPNRPQWSEPMEKPATSAFGQPQAPAQTQPPAATNGAGQIITPSQAPNDGRRLVVGRGISLNGQISTCDTLVVEGQVQAELKDCRQIDIVESGAFKGNAEIDNAVIAGSYEGNLTVRKKLTLRSTGRLTGSVRYGELEVETGGLISGDLEAVNNPRAKNAAPMQQAQQMRPTGTGF